MGIQRDWGRRFQQRRSTKPTSEYINSNSDSFHCSRNERWSWWSNNNRSSNKFLRCVRFLTAKQLHNNGTRGSISIFPNISRTRDHQSDRDTKSHLHNKRHRHDKYVYPVIATGLILNSLLPIKALAEGVGGVSATANPIANSSGSVTNQAIQVLQGPYITNTYGGGVQCQGSTLNVTPYIQFADSRKWPWEDYYDEPQYNMSDYSGRTTTQTVTVKNYPWESWYDDRTKADGSRWFED